MNNLAILIPYTPDRVDVYSRVVRQLEEQLGDHPVAIISSLNKHHTKGGPTTGSVRNHLLELARLEKATHIAFVDSDDLVSPRYIEVVMPGVYGDYDCCELWGQYYENGRMLNPFHHSIVHKEWWQDKNYYYRNPNHLNVIKLAHLHDIKFQDKTFGEDAWYSIDIQKTGRLVKEYPIKEIIYYYFAGGKKNHSQEEMLANKRGTRIVM